MSDECSFSGEIPDSFHRATGYVAEKASEFSTQDLLYLYGRYKQAVKGPCKDPMPSIFSFTKKSKWQAWQSLGEMSREEAMKQYVGKLSFIRPQWNAEAEESHPKKSYGPVLSTFLKTDPELEDESKTVFDWVKEGNVGHVREFLNKNKSSIMIQDEQGLSLIHWASDRDYIEIVSLLLSYGINIDCQDEDGQTALHYASSCGHEGMVKFLLNNGASANLPDSEGDLPKDVALTPAIKQLFHTTV